MSKPVTEEISADEIVSRFVRYHRWIRSSDSSVRPDAFMPPPELQLSVNRQQGLSEEALWEIGQKTVGDIVGRADLTVGSIMPPLMIEVSPIPTNANHAHIAGWPSDKPAQKNLAQRLAAVANYLPREH